MAAKHTSDFWKEARALRDRFGETEYETTDLLPGLKALAKRCLNIDELAHDYALKAIEKFDREDAGARQGFFPFDAHVPLGEKKRIQRYHMTLDHIYRRKRVIDDNLSAQNEAWKKESNHLYEAVNALRDKPSNTTLGMVLAEQNSMKQETAK